MTRRAHVLRGFASSLLPFALVARATQATPPPAETTAATAPAETSAGLLPPGPQPPERAGAPGTGSHPAGPPPQRSAHLLDYTAPPYETGRAHI